MDKSELMPPYYVFEQSYYVTTQESFEKNYNLVQSSFDDLEEKDYETVLDQTKRERDELAKSEIMTMEKSVFIEKDNIEFKDKRLLFSKQIPIRITFEEGLWIFENEKLEILSYGETFDLAWISFREDIIFIWELLGKEKESKLDTKAIEIKRILEDLVVSEESLGEQKK